MEIIFVTREERGGYARATGEEGGRGREGYISRKLAPTLGRECTCRGKLVSVINPYHLPRVPRGVI